MGAVVGKVLLKIGIGFAVSFTFGYCAYRSMGGIPLHELYSQVKKERLEKESGGRVMNQDCFVECKVE